MITYLGPFGAFTLKPDDGADIILFMATGSGLAPLKLMFEYLLRVEKTKKNLVLYLGLNNCEDVFMEEYFASLAKEFSNFKYNITVCNESAKWKGATGFITPLVKNDFPAERIYFEKYDV